MRILHLPHPQTNETLESYLSRILKDNCYSSVSDLNVLFELKDEIQATIYSSQKQLLKKKLSSPFTKGLWRDDETIRWVLSNEYLRRFLFTSYYTKVCPECLYENMYYRCVWRCIGYTTCHIHNCMMQSQCLFGRRIICLSPRLGKCRCDMELDKLPRDMIEQPKVNHNVFFQAMFDESIKGWNHKNFLSTFQNHEDIELLFRLVNIDYQNKGHASLLAESSSNLKELRLSLIKVYSFISDSDKHISELLGMLDQSIFSDRLLKLKEELTMECFSSMRDEIDLYLIGKNQKEQLHNSNFLSKIAESLSIASSHLKK